MLLLKIIVRGIFRNKTRFVLTVCAVTLAIMVFGVMRTFIDAWYAGASAASTTRLITRNAVSIIFSLPVSYKERIRCLDGVQEVSYGNWFGGIYISEKNMFANFCVDAASFLDVYPEFIVPDNQRFDFLADKKGAIAGKKIADKFGWKIGDNIVLKGTIYEGNWEFNLRGIYQGKDETVDETQFYFHWDYFNERIKEIFPTEVNRVGFYIIKIARPELATAISTSLDEGFKNSVAETLTETEKAFNLEFITMSEAIIQTIQVVSFLVMFIILAVVANTMTMAGREKSVEFATLKVLGFGNKHLAAIIWGETLAIATSGGLLGIFLTFPICQVISKPLVNFIPVFVVSPTTIVFDIIAIILIAALASVLPIRRVLAITAAKGLRHL